MQPRSPTDFAEFDVRVHREIGPGIEDRAGIGRRRNAWLGTGRFLGPVYRIPQQVAVGQEQARGLVMGRAETRSGEGIPRVIRLLPTLPRTLTKPHSPIDTKEA